MTAQAVHAARVLGCLERGGDGNGPVTIDAGQINHRFAGQRLPVNGIHGLFICKAAAILPFDRVAAQEAHIQYVVASLELVTQGFALIHAAANH